MKTPTEKIYKFILQEISDKKLVSGDKIPTEMELAKSFNTNRMVAYKAVKKLEEDGLVERKKHSGTFIRNTFSEQKVTGLRNMTANTIHVFTGTEENPIYLHTSERTLIQLENRLHKNGYKVLYNDMPMEREKFGEYLADISDAGSKATVFIPTQYQMQFLLNNLDILKNHQGEVFLFDRCSLPLENLPCHCLKFDLFDEGASVSDYLWKKGFTKIAFLISKMNEFPYWAEQRLIGAQYGLKTISADTVQVEVLRELQENIYEKGKLFLENNKDMKKVIIAQNDQLAAYFIDNAKKDGLIVKKDYHIISFDNDSKYRNYNLTTVAAPTEKIGEKMAEMIIDQKWSKNEGLLFTLKIASKIIERETCL